jgi:hypothetical protein
MSIAIKCVSGALSPGVRLPGREAEHSPPPSVEVEECVALYLHPQYVFMAWCLVKNTGITLPVPFVHFSGHLGWGDQPV